MHYRINDINIKSEYAAKSIKQQNKRVINFIENLPNDISVLDYGCGKLRYTIPLSYTVNKVTAIDSYEQLNKIQIINDCRTTVHKYAEDFLDNVSVYNLESSYWKQNKYDVIICTNVLSAIPDDSDRVIVLKNIKNLLNSDGYMFLSVQYRNSYFSYCSKRKDIIRYNDGWISKFGDRHTFYGIISPTKLKLLCNKANMKVIEDINEDGSVFVKAN